MKIKVLKLITLACAALMMVSAPAAKSQTRTIGWLKDYKFDVQPDGSVKYTIEGGTDKHNYMVYLVPVNNMRQRVDSAIVSPISGTFKMQGTVAKQGVYYVIYNDKIDVARGQIFSVKLFNDSFITEMPKEVYGGIGGGEIEGAPKGVVYVYHSSDTVHPVDAIASSGGFYLYGSCLSKYGAGYYSVRYKSEGRLIYSADSVFLCDSMRVNLYGKYKAGN